MCHSVLRTIREASAHMRVCFVSRTSPHRSCRLDTFKHFKPLQSARQEANPRALRLRCGIGSLRPWLLARLHFKSDEHRLEVGRKMVVFVCTDADTYRTRMRGQ